MDDVLAALRNLGAGAEERAKAVRHLSKKRGRMRYGEYRSGRLPIERCRYSVAASSASSSG